MEPAVKNPDSPDWFASYADARADCYVMLAVLLGRQPSEDLLRVLHGLHWDEVLPEKLGGALTDLRQASIDSDLPALQDEFCRLFVGLGCGEMVPYASWYRERKIQSSPLAGLRSDLMRLGIVRQAESHESEDHAGALCEVMALISTGPDEIPLETQARFFRKQIAPWMTKFFRDLQSARSARFYRAVGQFGTQFLNCESEYLKQCANERVATMKGGEIDDEY
jgi:TorA maturation chaperone TorD